MKLSYQWLNAWANTTLDAEQAGEILTLAGLELEDVEAAALALDGVVVAQILSAEKHPDADRLQICQVSIGASTPLQIVCGAPNARAGIKVALATIGTCLPGDFKIKKGKIRGAESLGMLCSGSELGLTETPGILELPSDYIVGQSLSIAMDLNDKILDIALTPNRGDCFSVRGIARELACLSETHLAVPFEDKPAAVTLDDRRGIAIEQPQDCSHYTARVLRGLDRQATTPIWMSERLRRSGLRSINPLVDVTNYVMLELGQPMHVFDLAKLRGDIQVRRARAGETLTLLNEQAVELSEQELVIADASGPVALAGAMGGLSTAVDDSTVDVLLESACFAPAAMAGTGRRFKLSSDSLQRFERGVDPAQQILALERASVLLMSIAGGHAGPVCSHEPAPRKTAPIPLSAGRVRKLLGCEISAERMVDILRKLECEVQSPL
jgi:phenylalanyl-tRNA synthetase beta chain